MPDSYGRLEFSALDVLLQLLLADLLGYLLHRLEHAHPWLYRRTHTAHHRIRDPQLLDAYQGSVGDTAVGESGDLTIMDEWITVQLKGYYFKPVIIAGPPTYHGTHAVVARIRNLRHGHDCPGWCFGPTRGRAGGVSRREPAGFARL